MHEGTCGAWCSSEAELVLQHFGEVTEAVRGWSYVRKLQQPLRLEITARKHAMLHAVCWSFSELAGQEKFLDACRVFQNQLWATPKDWVGTG